MTGSEALRVAALWTAAGALAAIAIRPGDATAFVDAVDCKRADTLCVDDTTGATQEFSTIQAAANSVRRGRTIVVFPGDYDGFRVRKSGSAKRPIVFDAMPGVRVVSNEPDSDDMIYLLDVDHVVIRGFEVVGTSATRYGIGSHDSTARRPSRGLEVRRNVVHGARSSNIYLSQAADALIVDNIAYGSRESHGIYLANAGSDDTTLRGNVTYGNAKNGIHFNGDARLGGDGVHSGLLIEANVVYGNDANGLDLDGVRDSVVRNNLIYDNARHGLRGFAIDAAAGPAGLTIVNNTFDGNRGWAIKLTQDDGGHVVFNNILLSNSGSLVVDNDNVRSDNNVVDREFSIDGENSTLSLAQWRRLGHDARSVRPGRVLFVRAAGGDYHLKRNAAAVDLGVKRFAGVAAPGIDLEGAARPQGAALDAGAFERVAATRNGMQ